MFTIIQDQQGGFLAQDIDQNVNNGTTRRLTQIEHGRHRLRDELRVRKRIQDDEPDAVRIVAKVEDFMSF